MTVYRAAEVALPTGIAADLDLHCAEGRIVDIRPAEGTADEYLRGLVLPAFADAHSHVFHRALRGRTHSDGGTFWTWRDKMYAVAAVLTPELLDDLAFATYLEMVCAGVTAVGEFHYLHHQDGGVPYEEPNLLGTTVAAAGLRAGLHVTLLDVAYLAGGFGLPLGPAQQRFSDGTAQAWSDRVAQLAPDLRTGVSIHSVRAVPVADLSVVAAAAGNRPLHVHLSEQPAENEACLAATGLTPTALLAEHGAVSSRLSAVHATHLTDHDIALLGAAAATAVICPTTEADLADGLPRAGDLAAAGVRLALGSDQHVIIDPLAQVRGLEFGERLATGRRGTFDPTDLLTAGTVHSHRSIASPAGTIEIGAPADFVELDPASPRTAGSNGLQLLLTAAAADVRTVVSGGRTVSRSGIHVDHGDPGPVLARVLDKVWKAVAAR